MNSIYDLSYVAKLRREMLERAREAAKYDSYYRWRLWLSQQGDMTRERFRTQIKKQ